MARATAIFDKISEAVRSKGAELVKLGGVVFQFVVSDAGPSGSKFYLDLKNGEGSADFAQHEKPDVTITLAVAEMLALASGKLDGMQAFMSGKLKIQGNIMLAQRLASILEEVQQELAR
mmetsp:Transcript_19861/g.52142  ORF Transcript_19861/g.52142 Transcript_19861/m.52142 type:complete len:119 (+) Transcript_19861:85-441(+)